ncbi:MAG: DUF485 domain-containing protein [Elusimicrobiota bacterium]|jgi:uncharacterized membrane protein (DUF485 family)
MGGLDFKAPVAREVEDAEAIVHNTRMGLILFAIYVAFYGGFMGLSAFWPAAMSRPVLAGVNLAIIYGFALIAAALGLALAYMKVCHKSSR